MTLLLWRWSTTAQIVSALILAVFFVVLRLSVGRRELGIWVAAWLVNLAALVVTVVYWFFPPQSPAVFFVVRVAYMFTKTLFVVLLACGASAFGRVRVVTWSRGVAMAVLAWAIIGAAVFNTLDSMGMAQTAVMLALFVWSSLALATHSDVPAAHWLAAGFTARAVLALAESAAHGSQVVSLPWSSWPNVPLFLASYSSFDAAAEWVIALGCVLMLYRTIQDELLQAQQVLQRMADRDPVTGLANRRALPAIFRDVYTTGATIFFFDLDGFKTINDSLGHAAGDDHLRRFAAALQSHFRPADHVVRYAGDEFLVVAKAVEPGQLEDRLAQLRRLEIRFSVGQSYLAARGDGDAAIKAADAAMYLEKTGGRKAAV